MIDITAGVVVVIVSEGVGGRASCIGLVWLVPVILLGEIEAVAVVNVVVVLLAMVVAICVNPLVMLVLLSCWC